MRWLAAAILALLIGRPVMAQTPKAAELIGQWRRQGDTMLAIAFGVDSTFVLSNIGRAQVNGKTQPVDLVARWKLAKDTLTFIQPRLKLGALPVPQSNSQARQILSNDMLRLLTLKGRVLTMKTRDGKHTYMYDRVGPMPSAAATAATKSERNNPLIEHS